MTPEPRGTGNLRLAVLALLLAVVTFIFFWPSLDNEFVRYDDQDYVTENSQVQHGFTLQNLEWALTSGHAANWHPLTWLSHMLDIELFGLNPKGHHLTSLLIHTTNAVLLFLLLRFMTGVAGASWFAAGLFAIHPLRVESVAWVAERKDVLSAFFFLATLFSYALYARAAVESGKSNTTAVVQDNQWKHRAWYLFSLACFAAGLLSKPMVVTLPFVLFLVDYWPLRRMGGSGFGIRQPLLFTLLAEKLPFFILSLISSGVTLHVQAPAKLYFENLPFAMRAANSVVSCVRYLGKFLWPHDLAVLYPHPGQWPTLTLLGCLALLLCVTAFSIWSARRHPYLVVGWLWFLGMLVPVLGLIQVGVQSLADRYTYLPAIGLSFAVVWGLRDLALRGHLPRLAGVALGSLILTAFALATWTQTRIWRDTETLFTHAAAVTQGNWVAHYSLALLNLDRYQTSQRGSVANQVVNLTNHREPSVTSESKVPSQHDYLAGAILHCRAALQARPGYADAHATLAKALTELNQLDEARTHLETAIRLDPTNPETQQNLAELFHRQGQIKQAVAGYRQALILRPNWSSVMNNLAWILATHPDAEVRDGSEAVRLAAQACNLTGQTNIWFLGTLAAAFAEQGNFTRAVATAEEVEKLARALGEPALIEKARKRGEFYRSGNPLRDPL